MDTEDSQKTQRDREMQSLINLADSYYIQHGRFPSKVRVGVNIGKHLSPKGATQVVTPDFTIALDEALGPDEVALDA